MQNLSKELLKVRCFLPELIAELEKYVPYASALVRHHIGSVVGRDLNEHFARQSYPYLGMVLTAFDGETFWELAINNLDKDYIFQKAKQFVKQIPSKKEVYTINPGEKIEKHFINDIKKPIDNITLKEKLDYCEELFERVKNWDKRVISATAIINDGLEMKLFANRNKLLSEHITNCNLIMMVVVGEKHTQYNYFSKGGTMGLEALEVSDEDLQKLVDNALYALNAERIEPGEYDIVVSPELAGLLAHEAFGHGVEMDMFVKNRARAQEYMNKKVASELVTMIEDPTIPGANGSYFFDDEGQIASPIVIIKDGILQRGITDLYSATVLGVSRSANGRRESFRRKTYARMSNTIFAPGESTVEELFNSVENGIYLMLSGGGKEEPKCCGIEMTVHLAREIKNGSLTDRYFSPVGLTGYVPDLLGSITGIANDFELSVGSCGKGHKEYIRVSDGGPHLRLKARLG